MKFCSATTKLKSRLALLLLLPLGLKLAQASPAPAAIDFLDHGSEMNQLANTQPKDEILVEISEVATPAWVLMQHRSPLPQAVSVQSLSPRWYLDPATVSLWVTVGRTLWDIVKAGQPSAHLATNSVSVLPVDQTHWPKVERWQGPMAKSYLFEIKNRLGNIVASYSYSVLFHYGGRFEGRGAYIANATVVPIYARVLWGWNLDSNVKPGSTVNVGTLKNPVPGLMLEVQWTVYSPFSRVQGTDAYFLTGQGRFDHILKSGRTRSQLAVSK